MSEIEEKFSMATGISTSELMSRLRDLIAGLTYISETDAALEPISCDAVSGISLETVLDRFGDNSADRDIEEIGFDEFFDRLICKRDWYHEREIARARQFALLKDALRENLTDLRVYRVGKVQIDIFIVGLDRNGVLIGVKTKAVET
jgi:Nuclease A inhibitor-like protein